MDRQGNSLLEVFWTGDDLRFTFLDRARPSLSFEQSLRVPIGVLQGIADSHTALLTTVRGDVSRRAGDASAPSGSSDSGEAIYELAETIRSFLFPDEFLTHVRDFAPASLLIRTNLPNVPWEVSRINGNIIGLKYPTGRSLVTQRPLKRIAPDSPIRELNVLIIANPTLDLDGAAREADALSAFFKSSPYITHDVLFESEATVSRIAERMNQGVYDVVHYAGHSDVAQAADSQGVMACPQPLYHSSTV
ncbi:MAG: CHAT domain-containing protein [Planctomycetota bacterium]